MEDLITYEELYQTFYRVALIAGFNERWFDEMAKSHGLPFMIRYIATELWVKQIPENEDTEFFRRQVLAVSEHGCFNVAK